MSVLIKSMAMPDNCYECRFMEVIERREGVERYICIAHLNIITDLMKRLDTCPLIELSNHGDLIERECWKCLFRQNKSITKKSVPAGIPAEKSEEECENENLYTKLDDPKFDERSEDEQT